MDDTDMSMPSNGTAYSYIRFSSARQELGDSLRRQMKLAVEYADKHRLKLDTHRYVDLGVSAHKGKHVTEGKLGTFIEAIDKGVIQPGSYLLIESLDRLSRQQVDEALELFLSIIRRGITIVTLQDQHIYSREKIREDRGISLIVSITYMMRAYEESATKATRVKAAWDNKRQSGKILTAVGPAWLTLSDDRKRWLEVPDKVHAVQRAFELAAKGIGTPTIADKLNEEHITTMGRAEFWQSELVMALLKNKSVIGTFTPKKAKDAEPIEGYYPTIIKPEVFYQVQEHIANRRRTGGRKGPGISNLFSGLLRCECGSRMRYVSGAKPHLYLRCVKAYSGQGCDAPTMPYADVEESILHLMCDKLDPPKAVLDDPTIVLKAELVEKKKALDNLLQVAELGKAYAGGIKAIAGKLAELEASIAVLEDKIKNFVPAADPEVAREYVYETWLKHKELKKKRSSEEELRHLRESIQSRLKLLLTKIVLLKDTHNGIDDLIASSSDPEELTDLLEERKTASSHDYRWMVLYGPFAERFGGSKKLYTDDGGLKLDYSLKAWGINGTRRRKTVK